MKKRRQPFGYQLKCGQIVVNQPEAEIVKYIFQRYEQGASYQELAVFLQGQDIQYDTGKAWNKNMIARILEDSRYLGTEEYPAVIQRELFQNAAQHRLEKRFPRQKTEAQKILYRLCGQRVSKQTEKDVLEILNSLIREPEQIHFPDETSNESSDEVKTLESKLESIMSEQPIDEETAKQYMIRLAEAQYRDFDSNEYETRRLQRLFSGLEYMEELSANILKTTISAIHIYDSRTFTVCLKNGQSLERS